MVSCEKTAFLWSLSFLIFAIGVVSIEVIDSTSNLTFADNLSIETTTGRNDELSAKYLDRQAKCSCGVFGDCSFDEYGRKVCHCQSGYSDEDGFCVECDSFWDGSGVNYTSSTGRRCICPKGYEERSENYCTDIDECKDTSICPVGSICKNTLGSYECPCKEGFRPYSEKRKTKRYGCTDIDECEELNKCPSRDTTTCIDTQGSYYCECKSGYYAKPSGISIEVEGCIKDHTSWRVGVIIFIVLGIISFGLVFVICKRRSSSKPVFV